MAQASFLGQAPFKMEVRLSAPLIHYGDPYLEIRPTQRALDWRVRAAFSIVFLAQANSVKMALPYPTRQQVTQTVSPFLSNKKSLITH